MKAILKFNRNNLLFLFVFIICIIFSNNVSAESYYAGENVTIVFISTVIVCSILL